MVTAIPGNPLNSGVLEIFPTSFPIQDFCVRILTVLHLIIDGLGSRNLQKERRMAQIHCRKCDKDAEAITDNLFMGKLEEEIKQKVCQTCWNEWAGPGGTKTMVINEYQLNLGDENARQTLKTQMRTFLKLDDTPGEFKDYRH